MRRLSVVMLLAAWALPAHAQELHVLVVSGLSGEPLYARRFAANATALIDAATGRWGAADENVVYLAEKPGSDPARIDGRGTRAGVLSAVARIGQRSKAEDIVFVLLLGHGSRQGDDAKLSLPGPDLTASDLAAALASLDQRTVVIVNAASASGDFLAPLSGHRRIVVTATKSGFERNATLFPDHFVRGLAAGEADTDKDERISIAEAFSYARREVARQYETERRLLTEHAQLDDNGDGVGTQDLGKGDDGALARTVAFGLQRDVLAGDPRARPLLAERRRLEIAIAGLRQRKATTDSTAYELELERLLVALAETNRALRALEQTTP